MKSRASRLLVFVALLAIPLTASAAASCENLVNLALPNANIDSSALVAEGTFPRFEQLPAFCRVMATLTPTNDSDIKVEIWLPVSGWNGKFEAVGNGGWAGAIPSGSLAAALASGYAT